MMKSSAIFLVVVVAFASAGTITRSASEINEYEKFLRNSVHGKPEAPITPELQYLQNEWERSGKFEGDMLLTEEQIQELLGEYSGVKNAIKNPKRLWTNNILYYKINKDDYDSKHIAVIEDTLKEFEKVSCIKVKKASSSTVNYVTVRNGKSGCSSHVGMVGKEQHVNLKPDTLGKGCFKNGTIIHEFLHALGFHHMQCTHNRDNYVKVVWEKIKEGHDKNFVKYDGNQVTNFGQKYDYGSIMHYSEYGFSIDGSKTLIPIQATNLTIGQRAAMSETDIIKLNKLYSCPGF